MAEGTGRLTDGHEHDGGAHPGWKGHDGHPVHRHEMSTGRTEWEKGGPVDAEFPESPVPQSPPFPAVDLAGSWKPWPFGTSPDAVPLHELRQELDMAGIDFSPDDQRGTLLLLLASNDYAVPPSASWPAGSPARKGWPFIASPAAVSLSLVADFLGESRALEVPEDQKHDREALLALMADEGYEVPEPAQSAEDIAEREAENRAEHAHRTAVEEALGEVPAPGSRTQAYLDAHPLNGPARRPWPFSLDPEFISLGAIRRWLREEGHGTWAESLEDDTSDRGRHLAAMRDAGVAVPGPQALPVPKPWPFPQGPQDVPLDAVRHWLWEQKYEAADLYRNQSDRSRHLAALRGAGVVFPDYRPDGGPDLPEFVVTLMEATDAQLDDAIDSIGADGRARLLRILTRKPKPAAWPQDEPQEFLGGYEPGRVTWGWPAQFVMGQAASGKSSLSAQLAAEYAAQMRDMDQDSRRGPDTADWSVEVVTRHHFSGVTAERASVGAVREARTGGGEVREVLTRREKPGRP